MQAAGITWKVYRPNDDGFGDALPWFAQYLNAGPGDPLYDRGVATVPNVVAAFRADVTNDTLPQVSWIIPPGDFSEHPSASSAYGEYFVKQLIDALASNPAVFNSTVFILTYDEAGGFFDHVPSPVPPPGTANEYVGGQPIGLGVRVPLLIISPWTRGGRVCSQVFDHTSILRFLETWTGVQEPNISAWRRQVCGDLTAAFDFAHPDTSHPSLTNVVPIAATPVAPVPSSPQTTPEQERGTRLSMPLPYQPNANGSTDCGAQLLNLTLSNAGIASVHFAVYANTLPAGGPWQYDVAPLSSQDDSFGVAPDNEGSYDFSCYGPNGFMRRFAGAASLDCGQLEVTSAIDGQAGSITLTCQNTTATGVNFVITDGCGSSGPWTNSVRAGGPGTNVFVPIAENGGWYDLTVTVDAEPLFLRRLVGHIETGSVTPTANYSSNATIWVNPPVPNSPPVTNSPPATNLPPFTLPAGISPTPPTNALTLYGVFYGTNLMLIYPNWASNDVVEFSPSLTPASWTPVDAVSNVLGNYLVVPQPLNLPAGFFRLRQ